MISVNLFSENSKEIEKFLSLFYNTYFDINNSLSYLQINLIKYLINILLFFLG